jgi:hypothetical protein
MIMTTRKTSSEAYHYLINTNLLRGKQALIIERLAIFGDATSGEVVAALAAEHLTDRSLRNVNAWRARFTELQERGLIVEAGERECDVTGRRAIVWRFTGRTKPLKRTRIKRGAKAWKALAMDLWETLTKEVRFAGDRGDFSVRIRSLGGHP